VALTEGRSTLSISTYLQTKETHWDTYDSDADAAAHGGDEL